MAKNSAVWAYVELGNDLVRVGVREDGAILTYASRSIVELETTDVAWMTYRSVSACAARAGVAQDLNSMALIGPNGGTTALAREIARTGARDGRIYTTAEICEKFGEPELAEKIVAFYATESEIAA